jgi:glycosyltransferase involved in cell wall biosynthesis
MKLLYVALDPLKYPRIKKIEYTFRKFNVQFDVMIPKFKVTWRKGRISRLLFAAINYVTVLWQILFVGGDIFWVANCPDILVLPLILRRREYILEYRSPWSIEVKEEFGQGPWSHIAYIIENIALNHAKVVTLTTSKLLQKVKPYGKPVFVIPNYPLKNFGSQISEDNLRKEHGIQPNLKIVLFIGRLSLVEGADSLPHIISFVLKKTKAVFWIVGDGPLYLSLKNLEKKYPNFVKIFGWQPHDKIPDIINASDICIAPRHETAFSSYYNEEGLHKISEYMFFQKPIVACGIAESREYLLVSEADMGEGVVKALQGKVLLPTPRTWEEHSEKQIIGLLNFLGENKF